MKHSIINNVLTKHVLTLALFLLGTVASLAQNIHGTVVDAQSGEPIVGAAVSLKSDKGGRTLAITDIDGKFAINVKDFPTTIVVSYTGYSNEEYDVYEATDEDLQVELHDDFNALNEVVVVGYGTQKRQQLTGSVTTVKADVFQQAQVPTLDQALAGQVAGLNVTASSGQPGAASQIRIRGGNSINASNDPLYVIDGFIYYADQVRHGRKSAQKKGAVAVPETEKCDSLSQAALRAPWQFHESAGTRRQEIVCRRIQDLHQNILRCPCGIYL